MQNNICMFIELYLSVFLPAFYRDKMQHYEMTTTWQKYSDPFFSLIPLLKSKIFMF